MSSKLNTNDTDTARCTQVTVQELEYVLSLVGPAKEEIAHLKEQIARSEGLPGSTISKEIEDLKRRNEDIKQENMKLTQQLTEKDIKQVNLSGIKDDLRKEKMKVRDLEDSVKTLKENEVSKEAAHKEAKAAFMEVNHDLETRLQSALKKAKDSERIRQQLEQKFEAERRKQQQEVAKLSASLKSEKMEKENIKKDLSETKSRLSKLMGDKLSDNNPDIADLSDSNRPTKLAEKYQELYDNQWTDAYEISETYFPEETEKSRIKILLEILMSVYKFCEEEYTQQERDILQAMYRTDKTEKQELPFPVTLKSQLKELKRHAAADVLANIKEKYLRNCDKTTKDGWLKEKVQDFVNECMTLCWFMVNQDPPLVFHTNVQKGDEFDGSKYKQYTATGTTIDFVVWPALLLHKDGLLLSKGVVQCARLLQGSKSVKAGLQEVNVSVMGIQTGSLHLNTSRSVDQQLFTSTKHGNETQSLKTQTKHFEKQQPFFENTNVSDYKISQHNQHTTGTQQQNQATADANVQSQLASESYRGNQNTGHQNQQNQFTTDANVQNQIAIESYGGNQNTDDKTQQNQVMTGSRQSNQPLDGRYQGSQATNSNSQHHQPGVGSSQGNHHIPDKNQQNQGTASNGLNNHFAGGAFKGNQHAVGLNMYPVKHGNNQQIQPAENSNHDTHTNANQGLLSTLSNKESNTQNSLTYSPIQQAANTADLGVHQQQSPTYMSQYPAHLIPTQFETNNYFWVNYYYRNHPNWYQAARNHMGPQIYDKCWNYQLWLQSNQFNVNRN